MNANQQQRPSPTDELFEERAAIREFDGGLCRADAEILAWFDVQRRTTINADDTEGGTMNQPSDHGPTRQNASQ